MRPESRRRMIIGFLLGGMLLAVLLYLSGLASTLQLGDTAGRGFLLVPALPTPLYITMALVVLAGAGLTLLASILHRRRPRAPKPPRESEARWSFWQSLVSTLASLTFMGLVLTWLMRHSAEVQAFLMRVRAEIGAIHELLESGARPLVDQVSSPATGYVLFVGVVVVYGGMALLALWVLYEDRGLAHARPPQEHSDVRRVRRAMTAGLRELREHADPRQAIIACYARLEHLLEDHGVPAYDHLTPQEYMGAALRGLDLPLDAFAGLIRLFELARYSLHSLDDAARTTAIAHLERLTAHLEGGVVHVARP
ncbi:MAG: DUF4129 domain-containing protein [Nitrospinae bacterium]|nr:DUF4129 domain-containing protein [Nitrospinota bacterium]